VFGRSSSQHLPSIVDMSAGVFAERTDDGTRFDVTLGRRTQRRAGHGVSVYDFVRAENKKGNERIPDDETASHRQRLASVYDSTNVITLSFRDVARSSDP